MSGNSVSICIMVDMESSSVMSEISVERRSADILLLLLVVRLLVVFDVSLSDDV